MAIGGGTFFWKGQPLDDDLVSGIVISLMRMQLTFKICAAQHLHYLDETEILHRQFPERNKQFTHLQKSTDKFSQVIITIELKNRHHRNNIREYNFS